jgi:hypothetical protein
LAFFTGPPQLPAWALPAGNQEHHLPADTSSENVEGTSAEAIDVDKVLADFCAYALTETVKKKLIERYQSDWQLMNGHPEHQEKCVQAMNTRISELKKAA